MVKKKCLNFEIWLEAPKKFGSALHRNGGAPNIWTRILSISNEMESLHFTVQILFHKSNGVQSISSFKILNDMTLCILLDLRNKIQTMKWRGSYSPNICITLSQFGCFLPQIFIKTHQSKFIGIILSYDKIKIYIIEF